MNKTKHLKYVVFVYLKENMITITHYMLIVKNVLVYDVLNTIEKFEKNYYEKLNCTEKIIKINLNVTEKY